MAKHDKDGKAVDPITRNQDEEVEKNQQDTGADWPTGAPGVSPTEDQPNFYEEVGLKNRPGVENKVLNEPPPATMVDKGKASKHQAEGPGGKGGLGGGGGA
jgi:hypothetical protein